LWHYKHPANGTANCSTPLFQDGFVFAASGYGTGGGLARIKGDGKKFTAEEQYFVKDMQNHHGGMVLVNGHIYGTGGPLMCVNFKSGAVVWKNRSVGKGSVAYADGRLYVRSEGGPVALVEATPRGYKETGRFKQPERSRNPAWAHPVIAGGKLYLRDWDKLFCYDIKAKKD
jgi:outer membrane protein assembly factor BamB